MVILSGAELLSYTQENRFLGDSVRFAQNKNLTVKALIYVPDQVSGVTGVFKQIKDLNALPDWNDIYINNENFGRGKINRITYPAGDWVRVERAEISITIYDSGDPVVLSGHYDLSGFYSTLHASGYLINSLEEQIQTSLSEDGSQGLEHSINIRLNDYSGLSDYFPCNFAETISNFLFTHNSSFDSTFLSGFVASGTRGTTRQRKYDLINDTFGFTKRYDLKSNIISGTTFSYGLDLQIDEKGAGTVVENGKIRGVLPDYYSKADLRYMIEALGNSYGRCSGMYYYYYSGATGILHNKHISLKSIHNRRAGTIDYSVVYSDNPNLYDDYIWDYQLSFNTNKVSDLTTFSEQGTFKGNSDNPSGRFDQAKSGFNNTGNKANAIQRINTVYSGYFDPTSAASHPLTLLTSSLSFKEAAGAVDYSYEWTNDMSYANLTGIIKRVQFHTTIKASEDLLGIFGVDGGDGYELEQQGPNFIPGVYSQSIDVELGRLTTGQAISGTGYFYNLMNLLTVSGSGTYDSTSYEFAYPALTAKLEASFKNYDGLMEL